MTEVAEKPSSGKRSTLKVLNQHRIEEGTEPKHEIKVSILGRGSRHKEIPLVQKVISHRGRADGFIKEWQKLKKAGIPTIPTVRKISPFDVVMTNMTADGSAFFGKSDLWPSLVRKNDNKVREIDQKFLAINLEEVETKATEIAKQATAHNIALPYDDPFDLLVHPDGSWQLVVLDIDNEVGEDSIESQNLQSVPGIMEHLRSVKLSLED